jgi:hypothetical protein
VADAAAAVDVAVVAAADVAVAVVVAAVSVAVVVDVAVVAVVAGVVVVDTDVAMAMATVAAAGTTNTTSAFAATDTRLDRRLEARSQTRKRCVGQPTRLFIWASVFSPNLKLLASICQTYRIGRVAACAHCRVQSDAICSSVAFPFSGILQCTIASER